jgi:DNA-binding transcriptional MerR regulator
VDLMSIGEFARLSRLSAKALRLYDELGLLPPAQVDPDSGYRWYAAGQLDDARLVASLRQIGVPLAQIQLILGLEPEAAAAQIGAYWSGAEADHAARRDLASHLVDRPTRRQFPRTHPAHRACAPGSLHSPGPGPGDGGAVAARLGHGGLDGRASAAAR